MAYGLVVLMCSLLVVRAPTLADGEAVSKGEASGRLGLGDEGKGQTQTPFGNDNQRATANINRNDQDRSSASLRTTGAKLATAKQVMTRTDESRFAGQAVKTRHWGLAMG